MRYTKLVRVLSVSFLLTLVAAFGVAACGGGLESCPGTICSNCAASGDCDITCDADEFSFCGHFGFFEDPGLRCAFCDSREDPFASRVATGP